MTETHDIPAPYFFLSYARSDPLAGNPEGHPEEDPDKPVKTFFADLLKAVRHHASAAADQVTGFCDQEIPAGADWKQFVTRALSGTQVFVPLYCVAYLTNAWPGRELTCFNRRVKVAGRRDPAARLVPGLWAPLAGFQTPAGLPEAFGLRLTEPEYADNGLRALLKFPSYRFVYEDVVDRMGAQIVKIAEREHIEPVEPEEVGDVEKAPSAFSTDRPALPVFNIGVAAPTAAGARDGLDRRAYGAVPEAWRPFPGQELSLAEYASELIKRFDFDAKVADFDVTVDPGRRRPGIIVIDPEFIARAEGAAALRAVAGTLPPWVLPLVVVARDDERTRNLADQVLDILPKVRALPSEWSGRVAHGVKSLDDFRSVVPVLVAEAERQYFRSRSRSAPVPGSPGRPRLGWAEGPTAPAASQDP